jgi:phosphinothricin acetyltransferase
MPTIHDATPADASALLAIYAPYVEQTAITFELEVPSVDEFERRIASTLENGYPYLVLEDDGRIVGYAYASLHHGRAAYAHSAEVSIYLDREARGQGHGRALYDSLEHELRRRGVTNLYACITSVSGDDPYATLDSVRFHEHMGYEHVGLFHGCGRKFGRWYDTAWMEKLIGSNE